MKKQIFKITGMHCSSCAMNIDGELEDTNGIDKANTNYAKAETEVVFDSNKIKTETIISIVEKIGYKAQPVEN